MTHYYEQLTQFERNGFTVIVDKTWEELHPRDCFEPSDVSEICKNIDNGRYDWFMLRIRVLFEGYEFACEHLGGCCYEDAREVLSDGTADDMIAQAMISAQKEKARLSEMLNDKSAVECVA